MQAKQKETWQRQPAGQQPDRKVPRYSGQD
jgi:hypothetical protein